MGGQNKINPLIDSITDGFLAEPLPLEGILLHKENYDCLSSVESTLVTFLSRSSELPAMHDSTQAVSS